MNTSVSLRSEGSFFKNKTTCHLKLSFLTVIKYPTVFKFLNVIKYPNMFKFPSCPIDFLQMVCCNWHLSKVHTWISFGGHVSQVSLRLPLSPQAIYLWKQPSCAFCKTFHIVNIVDGPFLVPFTCFSLPNVFPVNDT